MERTALKVFRIQQKMTQEQFAEKIGFSRGYYARLENGERDVTLRFLKALETAFDITFLEAQKLALRDTE